ncbi:MAG TPA: beta-ketoacyl-[acyl-carrier-protein] synthase family protein [Isosphaeraceae bacterium]|jgi:3-oxoacyl-[acyl-carrier-protein] synthase II|nr:beta-ketoacyl-[acyl-carrier-protein] synthase family protein [Isosphaeraceae bacterium]
MLRSERRVVITGLGLVSPIGVGPEAFWAALAEGRGGVDRIKAFGVKGLPTDVGGEIAGFDARTWPKVYALPDHLKALRKSIKYMARDIQLAVAAAELAIADAGLAEGGVDPTRIGVDLGAGLISSELDELAPAINTAYGSNGQFDYHTWGREGIGQIEPIWLLKYLPNMLACHISILLDCQGPSNTITEAEAASNVAIGEATRIIARGRADVMITGGADSKIHPLSLVRMSLLGQMSRWRGEPSRACKPFDRNRDGWVAGEGAGILVVEEREHALARGARIYGEILGFGSGCDAFPGGGLDPDGIGTEIALRAALRDSGLSPDDIGHVNAHGAATVTSDLAEAHAFGRVFGTDRVPVTALKGYMGNLVSGCGAVELIGSLLGVNRGMIPPTLNCDDPDPACKLDLVRDAPRATDSPVFLNTNLTRHGQAAAVAIRGNPAI